MTIETKIQDLLENDADFKALFFKDGAMFSFSNKFGFYLAADGRKMKIGSKNEGAQYSSEANAIRARMLDARDDSRKILREIVGKLAEIGITPWGGETAPRIEGVAKRMRHEMSASSAVAIAERKAVALQLQAFADKLAPVWPQLVEAAANLGKVAQLVFSSEGVELCQADDQTVLSFAFTEADVAGLIQAIEQAKGRNASSKVTFAEAVDLFAFAYDPEQARPRSGDQELAHLPISFSTSSLATRDDDHGQKERPKAEQALREFHAKNISPVQSELESVFQVARSGDVQFGVKLEKVGVHVTGITQIPSGSAEAKACTYASFTCKVVPYDAESLKMLTAELETLKPQVLQNIVELDACIEKLNTLCDELSYTVSFKSVDSLNFTIYKEFKFVDDYYSTFELNVQNIQAAMLEIREHEKLAASVVARTFKLVGLRKTYRVVEGPKRELGGDKYIKLIYDGLGAVYPYVQEKTDILLEQEDGKFTCISVALIPLEEPQYCNAIEYKLSIGIQEDLLLPGVMTHKYIGPEADAMVEMSSDFQAVKSEFDSSLFAWDEEFDYLEYDSARLVFYIEEEHLQVTGEGSPKPVVYLVQGENDFEQSTLDEVLGKQAAKVYEMDSSSELSTDALLANVIVLGDSPFSSESIQNFFEEYGVDVEFININGSAM